MKAKCEFSGMIKVIDPDSGEPSKVLIFDQSEIISSKFSMEFPERPRDDDIVPWTLTVEGTGDVREYYAGDFNEEVKKGQEDDHV